MADGTHATGDIVRPQLCAGGIIRDSHAIEAIAKRACTRPDAPRGNISRLVSAIAGIDEDDRRYIALTIPVIIGKIHLRIHCLHSLTELCFTMIRISTGLLLFRRKFHGAKDIEMDIEKTIRLVTEIVSYTTRAFAKIISRLIKQTIIELPGVFPTEVTVSKRKQNNWHTIHLIGIPGFGRYCSNASHRLMTFKGEHRSVTHPMGFIPSCKNRRADTYNSE